MGKVAVFQSGGTTIELNKVVAVVELPKAADKAPEGTALTVHMADGTNRIIRGDGDAEVFVQALNEHLGIA
jgi:hypothetical protein